MRKSVVGGRAWQLRAWLRVLCRWVADDAARQCGLLVRCRHRCSARRGRMREERSAENDNGSSGRSVVAGAAVTSADTRTNSSKVSANRGGNLLVHPGPLSSSSTTMMLLIRMMVAMLQTPTCGIFLPGKGGKRPVCPPRQRAKMRDCHCFSPPPPPKNIYGHHDAPSPLRKSHKWTVC